MSEIRLKSTGTIKLFENDNTSNITIASPASLGADRIITLPDASVTLASGTMLATDGDGSSLTGLTAGQIPNLAASKITSGTIDTARLGSGTASSSTVLYGDQTYKAEPGGDLTPSFFAYPDGNDSISDSTTTVVQHDVERYDTGGCYNNTGSTVTLNSLSVPAYSFCPNVAGKYFVYGHIVIGGADNSIRIAVMSMNRSGATANGLNFYYKGNTGTDALDTYPPMLTLGGIIDLNGTGEYATMTINCDNANAQALEWWGGNTAYTGFGAFRIQGVS